MPHSFTTSARLSVPAEIVFQHDERGKYDGRVVQTCMRTFRDGHFGFSRVRFL